jgi:hypothetical protein
MFPSNISIWKLQLLNSKRLMFVSGEWHSFILAHHGQCAVSLLMFNQSLVNVLLLMSKTYCIPPICSIMHYRSKVHKECFFFYRNSDRQYKHTLAEHIQCSLEDLKEAEQHKNYYPLLFIREYCDNGGIRNRQITIVWRLRRLFLRYPLLTMVGCLSPKETMPTSSVNHNTIIDFT